MFPHSCKQWKCAKVCRRACLQLTLMNRIGWEIYNPAGIVYTGSQYGGLHEVKSSYLSLISFRFCRENQSEQKSEIISGTVHTWLCKNTCGQRSRSLTVSQHLKEKVTSSLKPHNSHFPNHSCTKFSLSKQALRSRWKLRTSMQGNQHLPRGLFWLVCSSDDVDVSKRELCSPGDRD